MLHFAKLTRLKLNCRYFKGRNFQKTRPIKPSNPNNLGLYKFCWLLESQAVKGALQRHYPT